MQMPSGPLFSNNLLTNSISTAQMYYLYFFIPPFIEFTQWVLHTPLSHYAYITSVTKSFFFRTHLKSVSHVPYSTWTSAVGSSLLLTLSTSNYFPHVPDFFWLKQKVQEHSKA